MHVLLLIVAVGAGAVEPLTFGASPAVAQWHFDAAPTHCRLEQPIPDFGVARFERIWDAPLSFEIDPLQPLDGSAVYALATVAPPWSAHFPEEADVAVVSVQGGRIRASGESAERLLRALYQGRNSQAREDAGRLRVLVSPVNLRPLYEAFGNCVTGLRAARFAALEQTVIRFASGKDEIEREALARLRDVARYVALDSEVTQVLVDGHADASGRPRRNEDLSQRRAAAVAQALEVAGVGAEHIVVRHHAARDPVSANDTEEGRADNRRTTVRIVRGPGVLQLTAASPAESKGG